MIVSRDIPLSFYTTLRVGGPTRFFTEIRDDAGLADALEFASSNSLPVLILGGGSNLLVSDAGFPGLTIRVCIRGVEWADEGGCVRAIAGAGELWDDFVRTAVEKDLAGIECLSGIPGLIGGTPVQNVGAYGQEVSETIRSVRAYDRNGGSFVELSNAECGFRYRRSIFNSAESGRYIVLAVTFELVAHGKPCVRYSDLRHYFGDREPSLGELRDAVLEIRKSKGMVLIPGDLDCRSAGSFFKNPIVPVEKHAEIETMCRARGLMTESDSIPVYPAGEGEVKIPAARLIEAAGFKKGYRRGRAAISSKHTLAIVNTGGALASEILALADEIRDRVDETFGVRLQPEPVIIG